MGGGGGVGVVGSGGLLNTIEFNMAVLWWKHGVCVVCTKQRCFANKTTDDSMGVSSPRLVARSILDCMTVMTVLCAYCAKQSCFVKAYYRPFVGCDLSILDCSNMMTVLCVSCAKRPCFAKAYNRPFVRCFRLQQHDDGIARFMCETSVFR